VNSNPTVDTGPRGYLPDTIYTSLTGTPPPPNNPPPVNPPPVNPPPGHSIDPDPTSPCQTCQGYTASLAPLPVVSLPVKRFTTSLSADYQITEKTATMMSYNYGSDNYEQPAYHDTSHDVNAGLVYDLGAYLPLVKGRLNVGYSAFFLSDSRNYSTMCTVGISRDFDEVWSLFVNGGVRRTWSEVFVDEYVQYPGYQQRTRIRHDNQGWGWVASISLNYRGERIQENIAYVRDLSLASGLNGAAERNAVTFTTQYRLTYEFSGLFATSYSQYKSDPSNYSAQVIDQRTGDVNAGIRYEFSKDTAMDISYGYTLVRYPASGVNAYRQLVFIGLRTQFPFLE
jgi:predicted porin